ncbi:hypothetical protein BJ912DRAFT_298671 [Pholiota molesta]|nr:hypothetical protein BJ912DRAFT_298671 [Pholiota molesta]
MDPTQDMIVLLEDADEPGSFRIHIRTISTNAAHPLAEEDILHFDIKEFIPETITLYLEVTQNLLIVVLDLNDYQDMRGERVWIWDWTTSYPIMDTFRDPLDSLPPSPRTAFRLLDSASFFVASPSGSGLIQLYELVRSSYPPARHIATLHLPPTAPNTEISHIFVYAGPIEGRPYSDMPFTSNNEDRLHVLSVVYQNLDKEKSYRLDIFVHQRVFTKYISLNRDHPPLDIPWEEWGPRNTRIIPACVGSFWTGRRCVYSQHVLCGRLINGVDDFQDITNESMTDLDFSLGAILHAKDIDMSESPSPSSSESKQLGTLLPSTPIRAGQIPIFENDVETHLPCVFYERDFDWPCSNYMIHADGIVGVEVPYQKRLLSACCIVML